VESEHTRFTDVRVKVAAKSLGKFSGLIEAEQALLKRITGSLWMMLT
jgi:hypothetical protein